MTKGAMGSRLARSIVVRLDIPYRGPISFLPNYSSPILRNDKPAPVSSGAAGRRPVTRS